jgi:hypothetical protein
MTVSNQTNRCRKNRENDSTLDARATDINRHLFQPRLPISCAGCAKFDAQASEVFVDRGNSSKRVGPAIRLTAAPGVAVSAGAESVPSAAIPSIYFAVVVSLVGAWSGWIALVEAIAR